LLSRAIFAEPNCTQAIWKEYCFDNDVDNVIVKMGKILDGFSLHLMDYDEKERIVLSKEREPTEEDVVNDLKESGTEILLNYLPVGSCKATEFYAKCCLKAGVALINNIPEFVVSDSEWANAFKEKGIPLLGDDIKSQVGSTICSRYITQMLIDRGANIDSIYQTNVGGNTDFLNMTSQERLKSKKISKTESISCLISNNDKTFVYAGPNGYIESLKDNKISHMRFDFKIFGDISCSLDCKLSVEDSPNSAGVVIDCVRLMKIALDRGVGGPIIPACAYFMKHPPIQMKDEDARRQLEDFIDNKI
jgi:myo-inositol-1-phosphate synthase